MALHSDAPRLFALDAALRAEAEEMLAASGIGAILSGGGYHPVGSYHMHTMVWRDLDYERYEEPSWERQWEIGTALARTRWCVRLQCMDAYREAWPGAQPDFGLYWGLRVAPPTRRENAPPGDPSVWKLDIWTGRAEEFAKQTGARRQVWVEAMNEEARSHILALKEALCQDPAYRKSLLSVHVYEAVLERGIRGLEEFREWWGEAYGPGRAGVGG